MADDVKRRSLAEQIGWQVQVHRARRDLNQAKLAARAGITQQRLSRLERGQIEPTTRLVERVFAAMDLQVRMDVEPLGGDLDDEIQRYSNLSAAELCAEVEWFGRQLDQLAELPHLLSGRLAALIQGVPVAAHRLDLVVARGDLDRFAAWLDRAGALRWSEAWQDYGYDPIEPSLPGPMRWRLSGVHEVRMDVVDTLPTGLTVQVGDRILRVRPLTELVIDFPDIARVIARSAVL